MKELLQNLTREELQELGKKYIKDYTSRFTTVVLISKLSNTQLDADDIAWIKQANSQKNTDGTLREESVKEIKRPNIETNYVDEDTGRPLTTAEIEQKAKVQGERLLQDLVSQARRAANETVIAYVTPNSQEDINLQKTCESFITGNSYFTVSVVVPFGVHCEIPKAIAQVIREASCPQVVELSEFQRNQIDGKPIAAIQSTRKYNIQVWKKEEFEKMQEPIV